MLKTIQNPGGKRSRTEIYRHPVKLTALLYLKEALLKEQYENCLGIIQVAKEFGANSFEIQDLLEDARRSPS